MRASTLALTTFALMPTAAFAQSLDLLGIGFPKAIDASGDTVVARLASSSFGSEYALWTESGGTMFIGNAFEPSSISADGTTLSGTAANGTAARFQAGTGWVALPDPFCCNASWRSADGLSPEGDWVVGQAIDNGVDWVPALWSSSTGTFTIDTSTSGAALSVARNAEAFAGYSSDSGPFDESARRATIWRFESGPGSTLVREFPLASLTNLSDRQSQVVEITPDGTRSILTYVDETIGAGTLRSLVQGVAVGGASFAGITELGSLVGVPETASVRATDLSDDGQVVVGTMWPDFSAAFVWTPELGMVSAETYLTNGGVTLPPGASIRELVAVSSDGLTFLGRFANPAGEVFRARVQPWMQYGAATPLGTDLALDGAGDTSIGSTFQFVAAGPPTGPTFVFVGSTTADYSFAGGQVLIGVFASPLFTFDPLALFADFGLNTVSTLDAPIPNNPSLVGVELFGQAVRFDPLLPEFFAFSNGLEVRVR